MAVPKKGTLPPWLQNAAKNKVSKMAKGKMGAGETDGIPEPDADDKGKPFLKKKGSKPNPFANLGKK